MLKKKLSSPPPPGGTTRASDLAGKKDARLRLLESLVSFIRSEGPHSLFTINLHRTDETARADGWDSAAGQRKEINDILRALPLDVRERIRLA